MDFFAGSGTTLAVAHKMGRKWIGIEQMDYVESITKERLKKVVLGEQGGISKAVEWSGGGEFIYCELMPLNAVYKDNIRSALSFSEISGSASSRFVNEGSTSISSLTSHNPEISSKIQPHSPQNAHEQLENIYKQIKQKAFLDYRFDIQKHDLLKDSDFNDLTVKEKAKILYAILDSNMDYVPFSDIEDSDYGIKKEIIALNKAFYGENCEDSESSELDSKSESENAESKNADSNNIDSSEAKNKQNNS